jgi:hypothetical protein
MNNGRTTPLSIAALSADHLSIYQALLEPLQNEGFAKTRQSSYQWRLHLPRPENIWVYHCDHGRLTSLVFPSLI